MRRPCLTEDVKPVSEFRSRAAALVRQVRESKRPLVLTQHGRSAAVLLDVAAYEELVETVELLRELHVAERQVEQGRAIPHEEVRAELLEKYRDR